MITLAPRNAEHRFGEPNEEILTPEAPQPEAPTAAYVSGSAPAPLRCLHRYANGKQCRQSGLESQAGLCPHHFRLSNRRLSVHSQ